MTVDGAAMIDGVLELIHQDGEKATDLEVCYQILDYLNKCLGEVK